MHADRDQLARLRVDDSHSSSPPAIAQTDAGARAASNADQRRQPFERNLPEVVCMPSSHGFGVEMRSSKSTRADRTEFRIGGQGTPRWHGRDSADVEFVRLPRLTRLPCLLTTGSFGCTLTATWQAASLMVAHVGQRTSLSTRDKCAGIRQRQQARHRWTNRLGMLADCDFECTAVRELLHGFAGVRVGEPAGDRGPGARLWAKTPRVIRREVRAQDRHPQELTGIPQRRLRVLRRPAADLLASTRPGPVNVALGPSGTRTCGSRTIGSSTCEACPGSGRGTLYQLEEIEKRPPSHADLSDRSSVLLILAIE